MRRTFADREKPVLKTDAARDALIELLRSLDAAGYDFVTPTPATHARVIARRDRARPNGLRDVFGWSLPFAQGTIDDKLVALLDRAGALERRGDLLASRLRVSRVRGALFLHSAFPTTDRDAVFLGPDTYRFADFVAAETATLSRGARVIDIGAGAGVGGLITGRDHREVRLTLVDINCDALWLAAANAAFHRVAAELIGGSGLAGQSGPFDLVLANPPFIVDPDKRAYRDGGDMHGARLSLEWTLAAAKQLAPGGRVLLYTGSAMVDGRDALRAALTGRLPGLNCSLDYRELDPDIFGEELDGAAYADVERIAAIGAIVTRHRAG